MICTVRTTWMIMKGMDRVGEASRVHNMLIIRKPSVQAVACRKKASCSCSEALLTFLRST